MFGKMSKISKKNINFFRKIFLKAIAMKCMILLHFTYTSYGDIYA